MKLPREYICYQAIHSLELTGSLNKPFWDAAPWTEEFLDIEGDIRPRPAFRTRAKMLWDKSCLYIGAEMEEPHVWATLTEHDSVIFQDNDFELFIDPDGDNHDYYELEINALNTTWDLRLVKPYRDGGPALNEWEISGLRTAVAIEGTLNDATDTDKGWSVEIAIPWTALGEYARCPTPPQDGDQWRINFSRVEWEIEIIKGRYRKIPNRAEHNWVWSPQGVIDMHRPERWGYVQFSTAPAGTAQFAADPAAAARDLLMQVYYAQREFHGQNGRWADAGELAETLTSRMEIKLMPDGYIAACEAPSRHGSTMRWCVRQDSLLFPAKP